MPGQAFDTRADSVTREIVDATADAADCDPQNLPPLYDVVDPDALEAIANRPRHVGREATPVEVTFRFAGCTVTVSTADGVDVSAEAPTDVSAEVPTDSTATPAGE